MYVVMGKRKYTARVAIRAAGKYCVCIPKKFITSGEFIPGEILDVSISKIKGGINATKTADQ